MYRNYEKLYYDYIVSLYLYVFLILYEVDRCRPLHTAGQKFDVYKNFLTMYLYDSLCIFPFGGCKGHSCGCEGGNQSMQIVETAVDVSFQACFELIVRISVSLFAHLSSI